MADRQFVIGGTEAAPADWIPPAALEIVPRTAFATFDGTLAVSAFLPVLEIISDSGHTVAVCRTEDTVAAGASAIVSWFPGGELDDATQAAAVALEQIASPSGTITVGNASGPTATVDLATSGVTAGSYGDSSHSAAITVDADGRITAASSQSIVPSPAAGNIVAYGTRTTNQATSATTFAGGLDLLAAALSFTADGTSDYQVLVTGSFWIPSGSTASFMRCSLNLDGAEAGFLTEQSVSSQAGFAFPFNGAAYVPAPSAASHTVNARIYAGATGITPITVQGGTGGAGSTAITVVVVKL